ncbi:unnamed protein product [Cylicocyclus nassatus]|uniref:Uncharacterized protein n=1 Tax=Cylicocyclus nassatus TaxID=53992 RepID=A0AA36MIC8_CYLNA|nr:unnamed protein product [Cylicocyclus nassatus]
MRKLQIGQRKKLECNNTSELQRQVGQLKQQLDDSKKENQSLMEKINRYRMQKINGIKYVDELKSQISQLKKENDELKNKELLLN